MEIKILDGQCSFCRGEGRQTGDLFGKEHGSVIGYLCADCFAGLVCRFRDMLPTDFYMEALEQEFAVFKECHKD